MQFLKKTITLVLPILFLFFFYSCKKDKCIEYELTEEEKAFIPYKKGDMAVFRNDMTGQYDTLIVNYIGNVPSNNLDLPQKCSETTGGMRASISFNHLASCEVRVFHKEIPAILFDYGIEYWFYLSGNFQTITVNNVTYNDVYSIAIDSNKIDSSSFLIDILPWKIDYSKSKGFVRLYLRKNNVWSKI